MRHALTTISVCIFLVGCIIIGYMSWVLATSSLTVNRFMSGTQMFTYAVIAQALFLFANGLIGSVGSFAKSVWLVRLFIFASTAFIVAEIGGIITLNIANIQVEDVVKHAWLELNQGTRNWIQTNMECCGLGGPQEFAYSSSVIDGSCYQSSDSDDELSLSTENVIAAINPHFQLKQAGCGTKLYQWFEDNKIGWVSIIAAVGAVEFMAAAIALFILRRIQTGSRPRTLSRRRLRQHEVEIANDPLPSELP